MALPDRAGRGAQRPARGLPVGALGDRGGPPVRHAGSVLRGGGRRPRLDGALRLGRRLPRRHGRHAATASWSAWPARRVRSGRASTWTPAPSWSAPTRRRPGLGAWGKNTCLLHPEHGSWFFLGEAVTDLDLAADAPAAGHVRELHRLPRRLPHRRPPGALRPRRHALHQLPDHRGEGRHPEERREGVGRHVFGCDICQDVCPWNRRRRHRGRGRVRSPARPPGPRPRGARRASTTTAFRERFRRSAVKRAKRRGLLRNVAVALGNSGDKWAPAGAGAAGRRRGRGRARARAVGPAEAGPEIAKPDRRDTGGRMGGVAAPRV